MTTGLGIAPTSDGTGTDALTLRMIEQALIAPGIISGLGVDTSASAMTYTVAGGVAAVTRGSADGVVIVYGAGATVAADSGPASGSRIDTVWIRQHDPAQGDADNQVEIGVTEGQAATNPSAPTVPTGALELRRFIVPQGATTTSACSKTGSITWAIPYGGTLGTLVDHTDTENAVARVNGTEYVRAQESFSVPTDRWVTARTTLTAIAANQDGSTTTPPQTSILVQIYIDGTRIAANEQLLSNIAASYQFNYTFHVSGGDHVIKYTQKLDVGTAYKLFYSAGEHPGQRLQLVDEGIHV